MLRKNPDYKISRFACPQCDYVSDRVSHAAQGGRGPRAGDSAVCINCGALLVFADNEGPPRAATAQDVKELMADSSWGLVEKVRNAIKARGPIRKIAPHPSPPKNQFS